MTSSVSEERDLTLDDLGPKAVRHHIAEVQANHIGEEVHKVAAPSTRADASTSTSESK